MLFMQWYLVKKNIGGRLYHYRQRTYREGGKIRTQCKYVGPATDSAVSSNPFLNAQAKQQPVKPRQSDTVEIDEIPEVPEPGQLPIDWSKSSNPFWPSIRRLNANGARDPIKRSGVSISAMKGEYSRIWGHIDQLGFDPSLFANIRLMEGNKSGWRRKGKSYEVTLAPDKKGSGRNRFKRTYRLALAHAMLDVIETQSPTIYDRFRTSIDHSWFNTKMLVTGQILKSGEPHKAWTTLQFLWSGTLPRTLEKQLGKQSFQKLKPYKPGTWRDEAANLIADVIQRGYKPSIARASKDRARAKANAKRALTAYRKLNPIARWTKKGRKKWQAYKKHEAKFLLAHHKKSRLEMLSPFLADFHK